MQINVEPQLQALLTELTGVSDWNTIQFSMIPTDTKLGYTQVVNAQPDKAKSRLQYLVVIGIASTSLQALKDEIDLLLSKLLPAFSNQGACLGSGLAQLISQIDVETPDTYSINNNVSLNSDFKTSISLLIEVIISNAN